MACYAAIALLATFTLDGKFRLVVWIFLAGLAVRTYLATLRKPSPSRSRQNDPISVEGERFGRVSFWNASSISARVKQPLSSITRFSHQQALSSTFDGSTKAVQRK